MSDLSVSPQISDPVAQANVKVIAESPAQALGSIYQSSSTSINIAWIKANERNIEDPPEKAPEKSGKHHSKD